jgi:UDP-glucuronate 4-epimerase
MRRDFTYVDDIVEAIVRLVPKAPEGNPTWSGGNPDPATSYAPWRVFNIGNSSPVELMYVVEQIEQALGKKAVKEFLPMQPGDVPATYADVADLEAAVGFRPETTIEDGIGCFIAWFKDYHGA